MRWLREWRADRERLRRAAAYVRVLDREPAEEDVRWLTALEPTHDDDHARWELRYARRALGLLEAERDALDDLIPSVVARELAGSLRQDPRIGADRRPVAERQLNTRLRAYADALEKRPGADPTRKRLGATLLTFAGNPGAALGEEVVRAGDLLARYLLEANAALREQFGHADLPEDLPPSQVHGSRT